ncbi:hypothetical protein IE4803_PB00504 (plasmid) [Rhizobium etli bv. phaseoli str. IE4803]|nr:hypothetical protein IE4803_PB00504 [Rhizobium etli bv. phaseoli str. IE4803]
MVMRETLCDMPRLLFFGELVGLSFVVPLRTVRLESRRGRAVRGVRSIEMIRSTAASSSAMQSCRQAPPEVAHEPGMRRKLGQSDLRYA